ncbi:MAG TPA: hypothetical protein VKH43_13510, partial [Thermoanaerobaculia bacterium]|nr:hypothetical protein [Thermoanaerobaculia bacterium]
VGLAASLAAGGAVATRPVRAITAVALSCGVLFLSVALCEERLERRNPIPAWGERIRAECAPGCDGFLVGLEAYSLDFYSGVEWRWIADPARDVPRLATHRKIFLVLWSGLEVMLRDLPFRWRVVGKGEVLSGQWAAAAMGLRKREGPFLWLSLVEITPDR